MDLETTMEPNEDNDADTEPIKDDGIGDGTKLVVLSPPQQHTPDRWLPKGRGKTPQRRTPHENRHCCHDNVT